MITTSLLSRPICAALAAGAMLAGAPAVAQLPEARPTHPATRLDGPPPRIDGRLDEAVWDAAPILADFVQKEPVEGAAPSERTELRFLFDDEALYVGARMYARDPSAIQAPVSRRDAGNLAEHLLVSLDTYLDRRTAYTFGVTAAGVRLDHYHPSDSEGSRESSFDPVWQAAARVDGEGWTAEMRIPFSQLRFNDLPEQRWGLNVTRWIPSRAESVYWIAIPRGTTAWASRFGELTGISGIRPGRRVEAVPYLAADGRRFGRRNPDDPFDVARASGMRVGADLRMGLGPSLTLEATVNPDFGQVEADPAEVNLSAFESLPSERRPFFTEGLRYLRTGSPSYFYSRRIGAAPRVPAPGEYQDAPDAAPILAAAKLTGRTRRGLTLGVLSAVTDRASARWWDADEGVIRTTRVAPRAGWGVARAVQELGSSASTVGVSVTAVRRDLEPGSRPEAYLARTALSGGADWNLRLRGGDYVVSGFVGASFQEGDTAAIRRVQQQPANYLQRPDRDYAVLDPARTALAGYTAGVEVERLNARHWLWSLETEAFSPRFNLNDAGRMSVADYVTGDGRLTYRETEPSGWYRGYAFTVASSNGWDYQGIRRHGALRAEADLTLASYWRTQLFTRMNLRRQDGSATHGGPRTGLGRSYRIEGRLSNRSSAPVRFGVNAHALTGEQGDRAWGTGGSLAMNPTPRWQLSLEPSFSRVTEPRQFVAALAGGPAETFGTRYLFASIDRSTLSAGARLSYTFAPDLSLEVYAEPFAASGRYVSFGELSAARSFDLRDLADRMVACGAGDPAPCVEGGHVFAGEEAPVRVARDFNVRSFRSNTVLRWEWRPGSTVFAVWQQDRASRTADGVPVRPGALADALSAPGNDVLALKVTYWIGR